MASPNKRQATKKQAAQSEFVIPDTNAVKSKSKVPKLSTKASKPAAKVVKADSIAIKPDTEDPQPDTGVLKPNAEVVKPETEIHDPETNGTITNGGPVQPMMPKAYPNPPSAQASEEDKQKWQGFCEIESEPAYFNVMLNEFGVRGVKIRELYMLDMLGDLPQPVYGLILLFRYREVDSKQQEQSCPEQVWFANQTANNACATVAMLNIVMNVPDLELGENIQSFKEFTGKLSPLYRGEQLAHFDFVKRIHNSFAKKSDMLNGDLSMKNRFDAKDKKKQKKRKLEEHDEDDAAFHFIAYVPIQGDVWKLDGLDFQPTNIGSFEGSDWFPVVNQKVGALMNTEDLSYTLLAVVKDPIEGLRGALSENINTIKMVETRLDAVSAEWHAFTDGNNDALEKILRGHSEELGITAESLNSAVVPALVARRVEVDDDAGTLVERRERLLKEHVRLRTAIWEEVESSRADLVKAAKRRHDYGPLIQTWLRMLAEKGALEGLTAQAK